MTSPKCKENITMKALFNSNRWRPAVVALMLFVTDFLTVTRAFAADAPIYLNAGDYNQARQEFSVDVKIGTAGQPVTDLKVVSFELTYTNTENISYLSYNTGSLISGAQANVIESPVGKISAAVYRTSGGNSGYGLLISLIFKAGAGHQVTFDFAGVMANASDGSSISLAPNSLTLITGPPSEPIVADFTASPTSGTVPLTVQFTDRSTGNITDRAWDFGDGQTSSLKNPTHTFQDAGTYTISLTATGPDGLDSRTRTNYIRVYPKSDIPRAVRFSSAGDYVEVPHSPSIAPSEFTIEFWFRVNALGDPQAAGGEQTIIDKRGDNDTGYNFRLAGEAFPVSFHALASRGAVDTGSIFQSVWTHVAVTQDRNTLTLYLNGERITSAANTYFPNTGAPLRIGEFLGYPGAYLGLRGDIDDMRIWNYVRSQSDIQTNMKIEQEGSESGLAAYWDFNSQSDGIIPDLTANGNHGVMHGNTKLIELNHPVSIEDKPKVISNESILRQNYPNPFNPTTTIRYVLHHSVSARLMIFNLKGQRVKQFVAQKKSAGMYDIVWDGTDDNGRNVADGIYIYTIQAGNDQQARKMILLR